MSDVVCLGGTVAIKTTEPSITRLARMYHIDTHVHIQVKNGRCKSDLEFAADVSFKCVPYVMQKIEGKFSH